MPCLSIKGNWFYEYAVNVNPKPRKKMDTTNTSLDKSNSVYSSFADSAKKQLLKTLTNWTITQEIASEHIGMPQATPLKHHTFATLTLPSWQMHCDKVIKRECLNKFLIYMGRDYGAKNYLWKAEVQGNGNIHFHILFDQFLPWREVRNTWNRALNPLGYIDWFCHENNSLDPNSTDIHSINKVKNIKAYVAKYVSKEVEGRSICGHAWGRSENLNKLVPLVFHHDYALSEWLNKSKEKIEHSIFSNEWVGITKFKQIPNLAEMPYHHYRHLLECIKTNIKIITQRS